MPDRPRKMSPTEMDRMIQWLELKQKDGATHVCTFCGHAEWTIEDSIAFIPAYTSQTFQIAEPDLLLPFATITCNTCGHAVFFNAMIMGLFTPDTELPNG